MRRRGAQAPLSTIVNLDSFCAASASVLLGTTVLKHAEQSLVRMLVRDPPRCWLSRQLFLTIGPHAFWCGDARS